MNATFKPNHRWQPALRGSLRRIRPGLSLFTLLILFPALALAQSPFDTGFTAMQTLFTGTVAKVASLIAIVVGGYQFAHGEPGAKKLQPAQQEEALKACYQEQFNSGNKTKRILLPVRQLQTWIEHN